MKIKEITQTLQSVGPILWKAIKSGQLFHPQCELTDPDPDILCEYDVEIPMSEGFFVTANIYRSKKAADKGEKVPVVMCAHPYNNHLTPALKNTPLGGPPQQYRMLPQAGETLQLIIASDEIIPSLPFRKTAEGVNFGKHVIHFGGKYDSFLLVPKMPPRTSKSSS
jgi:predicted acyl esterase